MSRHFIMRRRLLDGHGLNASSPAGKRVDITLSIALQGTMGYQTRPGKRRMGRREVGVKVRN